MNAPSFHRTLPPLAALVSLGAALALTVSAAGLATRLDGDEAVHLANRLTFGATATTVERLQAGGLNAWLDVQLRPERLPDPRLEARLALLTTLSLTPRELAETYYIPAQQRRRAAAAMSERGEGTTPSVTPGSPAEPAMSRPAQGEGPRSERRVVLELATQKLIRATAAERQLEEILVDFWFNHFNVFAGKGPVRQYVYDFERTAIRPHVLGSFREMLGAVAGSPAMLFYLDNWQSSAPGTQAMRGSTGLNENYARELLELHTVGVDGGYTQADVVDVARAFTGWTIRGPRRGGDAFFDPQRHDRTAKTVLGQAIAANGGRSDGERVLDILARHPATARHIARKLAARFVSDTPPDALISRVATRFTQTNGDLRATVATLVTSPELVAPAARLGKVKTPLEFVASAVRAIGSDVMTGGALGQHLRTLGMPPYHAQPPTGFSDRADAWTNGGALVQRMNIAVALTHGRLRGVSPAVLPTLHGDDAATRARAMARALLLRDASATTLSTVARAATPQEMAALVLGSPEFQRR